MEKKFYEFQEGDIAEFGGEVGVVRISRSIDYPVCLSTNLNYYYFTIDGKYHARHTRPSLVLVKKAVKKVTKQVEVYANIYESEIVSGYMTKQDAESNSFPNAIATGVRLTGSYEVGE